MKRKLSVVMVVIGTKVAVEPARALREGGASVSERLVAFDGRIFNVTGVTTLVEFSSSVEAVRCALALVSSAASTDQRLQFGISVGDVVDDGGNLFGDVVNVAARLADLAGDSEICVTRAVFEQAGQHIRADSTDLGLRQLKNLRHAVDVIRLQPLGTRVEGGSQPTSGAPRPWTVSVAAAALGAALIFGGVLWQRGTGQQTVVRSIDQPSPTAGSADAVRARRQERCREILERVQSNLATPADRRELGDTCR